MKTVLIYSGGLDSTVLLAKLLAEGREVLALSVNYGQRHIWELHAANFITYKLKARHQVVDLRHLRELMQGSSQTDSNVAVPHGHYEEESMKKTVVPNRNMILIAVAGAWAISLKADTVAYAAHAGDHAIYPDCREDFVAPLSAALANADWHKVAIERPFLHLNKAQIVRLGHELQAPMEMTYSCYEGDSVHCGICGTDIERRLAFREAGVVDSTQYKHPLPDRYC